MSMRTRFTIILSFVFAAACIETDIYLPAFPDMMDFFGTTEEVIQSLLTWNFFALCLSSVLYGPASDAYGRKPFLIGALSIFLVGSLITVFSDDFGYVLLGRVFQGLGSGGCFTLGSAMIFDSLNEEDSAIVLNRLNTLVPLAMGGAPLVGAYLNQAYGFRANFEAIAITVALSLVICAFGFEEPLSEEKRRPLNKDNLKHDFKALLTSFPFWQICLFIGLVFAAFMSFLAGITLLFICEFGVPKTLYPFYQGSLLLAYVIASLTCSPLIERIGMTKVRDLGAILSFSGAIFLSIAIIFTPRNPELLTLSMIPFTFGMMYSMTPSFATLMNLFPEIKGLNASLLTSFRLLITAAVVDISSRLYDGTIYPVALTAIAAILLGTLAYAGFAFGKGKEV